LGSITGFTEDSYMSALPQNQDKIAEVYHRLSAHAHTTGNSEWLACMLASWHNGAGALPDYLGLEPEQFSAMRERYFPAATLPETAASGIKSDFSRMLEKDDLIKLLRQYAVADDSEWIIAILVAGSLGSDHLWQDLGLWNRGQLTALLEHNFPELAAKNDKNMKWKRFLYKQLCESEGLYLCRVPSCDLCIDYGKCYGDEN